MATDISNGALSWDARITTGNLQKDVKTVAELIGSLGYVDIDMSAIEKAFQDQAQKEIELQKQVTSTVKEMQQQNVSDFTQAVQQQAAAAKISVKDLQDYIAKVKADSVGMTSDLPLSALEKQSIADNQTPSPTIVGTGLPVQLSALQGVQQAQTELNAVLQMAKEAYADADAVTKKYYDELTVLELQLRQNAAAQKDLVTQFNAGDISEDKYISDAANLKASQEEITASITETKEAQKQYQQSLNDTQTTSVRLRTELRNLQNQIAEDKLNGIINPDDINRAVQLDQALRNTEAQLKLAASNTAFIDAMSDGIKGLVGGFTALSGVIGVFTSDQDKANKIMTDSVNLMSVIFGLEQLSQTLATNGALNSYLKNLLQKNTALSAGTTAQTANNAAVAAGAVSQSENAAATEADAAAKVEQTEVTEGATTAQWSLNAAMAANPAGVILLAVTGLIAAFEMFANNADSAAAQQSKLNQALLEAKQLLDQFADIENIPLKENVQAAENQLAIASALGKSNDQLKVYQQNVINAKQALNDAQAKQADFVGTLDEQNKKLQDAKTLYEAYQNVYNSDKSKGADDKVLEADKSSLENAKYYVDKFQQIYNDRLQIQNDAAVLAAQSQKQENDAALQSDTSYWQAKVTLAREGTKQWLDAQKQLNQATYNKTVSNPNATPGEIALAQAQLLKANKDANDKYNLQQISDTESVVNAQLDLVVQGSDQELALKLKLLEQQKQAEIINAQGNAATIEKINADSLKKQDDLKKQYLQTQVDRVLQFQQDYDKQQLAGLSPDTDSYVAYTKDLNSNAAQQQTEAALKQAQAQNPLIDTDTVKDALNINTSNYLAFADKIETVDYALAEKIRAVWADTAAKNQQVDNASMNTQIDNANKIIDIQTKIAKQKNDAIIANPNSSDLDKANAYLSNNGKDIDAAREKLENIAYQLQQNYGVAGVAVQEYINAVTQDFSKITQLSNKDSDISHVFDGIKDPKVKQDLEEYLTLMNELAKSKDQLDNQKLAAVFEGIEQIGSSISNLGNNVAGLNDGLADTLNDVGQIVSNLAQIGASVATGNIAGVITGIISLVSSVVGMFSAAKKSAEEAAAQMAAYNTQLITGQAEYNEELLKSQKIQDGITRGMEDQLAAQIELNNEKLKGYQTDLDSLTTQLAANGQYVSGEHTEKYGGFLGIAKKTKVVQDFASLGITSDMSDDQIAALLKQKEAINALTGTTKTLADEWLSVYDNIGDATDQAADLKEQFTEAFTGTTADDIAQTIIDGLEQGKSAVDQFGDDFNKIISNALLASIKNTLTSKYVSEIWDTFQSNINADGSYNPLTPEEIATIKAEFSNAITGANELWQQMEELFPDFAESVSNGASGLTGAIQQSLTEATGDELAGLWRGQYDITKETLQVATDALEYQQQIAQNTSESLILFSQHLPLLQMLKDIKQNTTPTNTARNMGLGG